MSGKMTKYIARMAYNYKILSAIICSYKLHIHKNTKAECNSMVGEATLQLSSAIW